MAAVVGVLTTGGGAGAQPWPTQPIRVVVPLSAGSAADVVPRIVLERAAQGLGQPTVIENRTGASGTIGVRAVAAAAPDGYTLLAHSSGIVVSPFTIANAHYDPVKDFVAVAPLASLPNVLVVSPASGVGTVREFVARARARRLTFGTVGAGTPVYLAMEKFRLAAGIEGDFVPFRGAPEAITEVMAGRVDAYYAPLPVALEFIRSGRLTALCVSSRARSSALPEVPTSLEAGYPDSDLEFWIGVFAPAGTPAAVVERLNHEIGIALDTAAVRDRLTVQGIDPMAMTAPEFQARVGTEQAAVARLARVLDLKPQ